MIEKESTQQQTTFARDLGLFDATMIGVGAMIGAGIFVLTGIAAGVAGPASILAFALNAVVTLITAFAYAELASAIPRAGGGYSFVRMAFPGAVGFIAGWLLWFAYIVACSLYALGFAGYFWEFFHKYTPNFSGGVIDIFGLSPAILGVTLFIGIAFIWLNARGAEVTGKTENILTMSKIVILAIFIFFGILAIIQEPARASESFTPFFPLGFSGVLVAMGLTFIAFEGYDLIATVAEEIKNPEKNIPKATFISLSIAITIYLLILFVSLGAINPGDIASWEFLGEYKETAIVRAAEDFMPAFGVLLIVFGGLLSTMSALNATVMAASRVAFSMGRDNWLPSKMAVIHPKRRTPHVAIIVTGFILLAIALTLPIEAVGSAASLIFLLTFAFVNLSVVVLRRKYPEIPRKYKVPFYPVLPFLGFVLNIFLAIYQFNFQPIAWFITLGWIVVGLLLYYSVFEKKAHGFQPSVLMSGPNVYDGEQLPSIVVALYNPNNVKTLLDISYSVAQHKELRIIAISVIEVPRQMPLHEGMRYAEQKENLFDIAKKYAEERGFNIEIDLVIAHRSSDGILEAVDRHKADTLVMGWKGYTDAKDRIFGEIADNIIRYVPCDLLLLKITEDFTFSNCLLPTSGGPNAKLASDIIDGFAENLGIKITACYIVPENPTEEQKNHGYSRIEETVNNMQSNSIISRKIIESNLIPEGISEESKDYDLVVIGAAKEPFFKKMLFGEIPEKVARKSQTSVLVVKRYEGFVKSAIKKVMG